MNEAATDETSADLDGRLEALVGRLCEAGWTDGAERPKDGQFVAYLFEPFMKFYCGTYDADSDSVHGSAGFTSWQPEILVWHPLPPNG